jgi:hypothetical protein
MEDIKISENIKKIVVKKTIDIINRKKVIKYSVNGIIVATGLEYSEYFCTIKNGVRSNISDKVKTAKELSWSKAGIVEVTGYEPVIGSSRISGDFNNKYPDTTWGDTGSSGSIASIKEQLINFINEKQK